MGRALASRPTAEAGPACLRAGSPTRARAAPNRRQAAAAAWPPHAGDGVRVAPQRAPPLHTLAFTCPTVPRSSLASPLHQPQHSSSRARARLRHCPH